MKPPIKEGENRELKEKANITIKKIKKKLKKINYMPI